MSQKRDCIVELTFACPDVSTVNKPIKVYGILDKLEVLFVLQVLWHPTDLGFVQTTRVLADLDGGDDLT